MRYQTIATMLLSLPLVLSANFFAPKKEALIVGVGNYQDSRNAIPLAGVKHDVRNMREILEAKGFHVRVLQDSQATMNSVRQALSSYSSMSSDDVFVFYDSSHGSNVPDKNGDEADGYDEAILLYDTKFDKDGYVSSNALVDDELFGLLEKIKAKKLMLVDACHSGTMYKSIGHKVRSKAIKSSKSYRAGDRYSHKATHSREFPSPTNLVSMSAARENERSLDTDEGGMFTSAIYDAMRTNVNITFNQLEEHSSRHITDMCNKINARQDIFHPVLYATNQSYTNQKVNQFLKVNIKINPRKEKLLVEEYLDGLMAENRVGKLGVTPLNMRGDGYNSGDIIHFNIDTHRKQGYMYILTIGSSSKEIEVLYPNPHNRNHKPQIGAFTFPFQGSEFQYRADKRQQGAERTVVYTILSDRIITELDGNMNSHQFQSVFKDFRGQSRLKNAFKDILVQRRGNRLSIAKSTFFVR